MKALLTILLLASTLAAQTVTVVPGTSYQTMRGWMGAGQTGLGDFLTSGTAYNDNVLQAFVDMGGNAIQTGLVSGLVENTTDYWGDYEADGRDWSTNAARPAMLTNRYIPVNDNGDPNSINASGFKFSSIDWDIDNYITPLRTKLAARGETLYWSLVFTHQSTSNQLHIDTAAEYGEIWLALFQHLDSAYPGLKPNAIEIQLEPDGTPVVTASELAGMINAVYDRLSGAGYTVPHIYAPSSTQCPNGRAYYLNIQTASATAASRIDTITYHRYVDCDATARSQLLTTANTDSKKTAQVECAMGQNCGGANDNAGNYLGAWEDLEEARVSIWEQYAMGYPTTDNGDQYFTISGSSAVQGNSAKYLQMLFKYVRAGAVMKGVTNSGGTCKGLPFQNSNGTYVVVLKATGSVTCTVEDLPPGTYGRRRTQGDGTAAPSSFDSDLTNATVTTTEDVTFAFTAAGIGVIYDVNYLQSITPSKKAKGVKVKGVRL